MGKKVLVIGGGAREHALAWKLRQSPQVDLVDVAPGNAGTAQIASNVPIQPHEVERLCRYAWGNNVDLTVVGSETPLAAGIVDRFAREGLKIFGPTQAAFAATEGSKIAAKELMVAAGIPTAYFRSFSEFALALNYVGLRKLPMVIKVDGLASGKGVFVCRTNQEAEEAIRKIFIYQVFGKEGESVVIEDYLEGQELSIHALCDGKTFVLFPPSQDHKSLIEGGLGPNTGGMGAIAPVPWVKPELMDEIAKRIVVPYLGALARQGTPFVGCLYPGLMVTKDGPMVLEFNARFGDPEAQVYLPLLKGDLFEILLACVEGQLNEVKVEFEPNYACCVTLASRGYPDQPETGFSVTGLGTAQELRNILVFHAGTNKGQGRLVSVTSGGRVLSVVGKGETLSHSRARAYKGVSKINFAGMQFRSDIGVEAIRLSEGALV